MSFDIKFIRHAQRICLEKSQCTDDNKQQREMAFETKYIYLQKWNLADIDTLSFLKHKISATLFYEVIFLYHKTQNVTVCGLIKLTISSLAFYLIISLTIFCTLSF